MAPEDSLLSGTVTFLFTDIEGSTRLLSELGDGYADVVDAAEHTASLLARKIDGRACRDAQADAGSALEARHPLHDAVDGTALEHLVLEQLVRERVELNAVREDHPLRRATRLLDQLSALLVADPQRRLRQAHIAVW